MKKILIILCSLIFCSCAHTYTHMRPNIPFDSFVRIEAKRYKANCFTCVLEQAFGSGTAISSSRVLTAGHVCAGIREMVDTAYTSEVLDKVLVTISDDKGNKRGVIKLDIHPSKDICLMKTDRPLLADRAAFASSNPARGKEVWSMMAPDGVVSAGLVPVVSGYFAGGDHLLSVFTIPAHPGSSGAPILNATGEIIGIVSQINKNFHHIVISPSRASLINFIVSLE